ncbi:MAG: glycosyltransferase [Planctomycetes bacterium]|nr:glycosyltransferase [Planctomycetota bacterium]
MRPIARALAAARFGVDVARACGHALAAARPRAPRPASADDEVHLLVEADPSEGLSPAARYRALQYVPLLEAAGLRCHVHPSRPGKYFTAGEDWQRLYRRWPRLAMLHAHWGFWRQRRHRRADFRALAGRGVVFLQRDLVALPGSRLEHELPRHNRHVVFDFDDAIFVRPPWSPGGVGIDQALHDKIAGICALSTSVVAANEHLAAFARRHTRDVHVVPTTLCTDEFRPPPAPPHQARPVVGWVGTSGNLHYLRRLGPALRRLATERDFVLRVICNRVPAAQLDGLPHDLEFLEWRAADEVARIQQFDVGIMPLEDDAWAAGKAAFKLVQYMACGVPFVASPVGANPATGGPHGDCGLYAADGEAWCEQLAALLDERDRRHRLGQRGRERAVALFDRRQHAPALVRILRSAAQR